MAETSNGTSHDHPVVEIITRSDKVATNVESGGKALKVIAGSEAFRRFDWLRGVAVTNRAGNLRGMVVSRAWRTVFEHTSKAEELVGKAPFIVAFAANLAEQHQEIEAVMRSSESPGMKAMRLAPIAGTAAQRTLAGIVTGPVSLALLSAQGYCQAAGLLGGKAEDLSMECVTALKNADTTMNAKVKAWTDTNRQGEAIARLLLDLDT